MKLLLKVNITVLLICILSCNSNKKRATTNNISQNQQPAIVVGADKDEHDCKASAGYRWSLLKNDCIRLFETGIRLDPQNKSLNQSTSAFAVFKSMDEDQQVELFLPTEKKSILLNRAKDEGAGLWKNKQYSLAQWKGMYTLTDVHDHILYQGMIVP